MKVHEILMLEMANLTKNQTGLDHVMFFGEVGGQHGPRIKVCNVPGKMISTDCFTVRLETQPVVDKKSNCKLNSKKLKLILKWVKQNLIVLIDLYYDYEKNHAGNSIILFAKLKPLIEEDQ